MKGIITTKNEEKGFGFITPEGMEPLKENNIFFHSTGVEGTSFEALAVGNMVEFEKEPSPKGDRAVHVTLCPPAAPEAV